jgi:hypothetical protein
VGLASKAAEHGVSGGGMGRFPDECAVEFEDSIGPDDEGLWMELGDGLCLGTGKVKEVGANG